MPGAVSQQLLPRGLKLSRPLLAVLLGSSELGVAGYVSYLIWSGYGAGLVLWEWLWIGAAPVGAMTAALRPRHPVGWLLLALGGAGILSQWGFVYDPGSHPTVPQALLMDSGIVLLCLGLALAMALIAVFPSGDLGLLRRHRWLTVVVSAAFVVSVFGQVAGPYVPSDATNLVNPLRFSHIGPLSAAIMPAVGDIGTAGFAVVLALVVVNLGIRLRRSRGVERQQLKWFAASSLTLLAALVAAVTVDVVWSTAALAIAANALFVSIGLAIVRYHLYDVDRVFSRAVSYLLVLGLLGGVYVGSVLLLSDVLPLRGSITVALAVLVAVALLAPVHRRMRDLVDRRFDRSRYDAQQVVRLFAARVGEEVSQETISQDLLSAVQRTVQPASVGLWMHRS